MHKFEVQISEQLYEQAKKRAAEAGFRSVNEYVVDMLKTDVVEDENWDHLFTPERMAKVLEAKARVDAGEFLTMEQVDAQLAKTREEWLRNQRG